MADFETTNALRELDRRTPVFLRLEVFAHGDLRVRKQAEEELRKGLNAKERKVEELVAMLTFM